MKYSRAGPKSGPKTTPCANGVDDWGFVYPENISADGGSAIIDGGTQCITGDGGTTFIGIEGVV